MPFNLTMNQKQTALWVGLWLLLMVILVLLGPILAPFIIGAIMAYILNPSVERISRWHIGAWQVSRPIAVVFVLALVLAVMVTLVLVVVPVVQQQIPLLSDQVPGFLVRINETLAPLLQKLHVEVSLDPDNIKTVLGEQIAASKEWLWKAVLASAKVGGTALLGWIAVLTLTPVVVMYLLLDWRKLLRVVVVAIPRRWARKTISMAKEVDELLAQYLRGQFMVMLVLAVYYSVGLAIAGFDAALPVGMITGLLAFIPYVGFGLGLILALLAGLLQFAGWKGIILVALVYSGGQALEGFYLTPKLVGKRIGLHPLVVIFALLAFGHLFGFVGVLLALPSSAILSVMFRHLRTQYVKSDFYTS